MQTYYGIQDKGLPYPNGTSLSNLAVQLFKPLREIPSNSKITANVYGFAPSLECQVAKTTLPVKAPLPAPWVNTAAFITNISTPYCTVLNAVIAQGAYRDSLTVKNSTQNYQGGSKMVTCNDGSDNSLRSPQISNQSVTPLVITISDLRWNAQIGDENITNWRVENLTAVLCKPSYSLDEYRVSFTDSSTGSGLLMEATSTSGGVSPLPGFGNNLLGLSVEQATRDTTLGLGGEDAVLYAIDSFFQLMALKNNNSRQEAFMDAEVLQDRARSVFTGLAVQIAHQYLTSSENQSTSGTIEYTESRLRVKRLSVGLMATTLGLLEFISIFLLFVRPRDVVSQKPDSISAVSLILSNSKDLKSYLSVLGSARLSSIRHYISNRLFRTTITENHFCIEPATCLFEAPTRPPLKDNASQLKWWRPVAVKLPMRLLIVSIPIVGIWGLEVLQRLSDRKNGFINIAPKHGDTSVIIIYLPALIMLLIATMYMALDSTVATYAPYNALWHGDAPARRSIMVNVQGMMPPHALLLAIRSRYSAVCFTILATFMGSFLSILVSGLYTIVNVPFIQAMAVQQMDTFDFNQGSLYNDDNLAGTITSLIVHQNLSYPPWTYDNLVFPTVATPTLGDFLDANSSTAGTQAASITVILPAVRASLNCSAVSSNAINMTDAGYYYPESYLNSYDPNDAQLTFNATIPWLCRDNPSNISEVQWVMSLTAPLNVTGALSGAATVLSWSVDASVQGFHLVGYGPLLSTRIFGTLGMGMSPAFLVPDQILTSLQGVLVSVSSLHQSTLA